jgi:hypothetical protein
MPSSPVNPDKLKIARDIQLADEQFCLPRKVEMIIRADLYACLIRPGWILLGRLPEAEACHHMTALHVSNIQDVESQLQKFWEQEEVNVVHRTNEKRAAGNHFIRTTIKRSHWPLHSKASSSTKSRSIR